MKLNTIVSDIMSSCFPRQELVFTNTTTTWETTSRTPTITTSSITLLGRIQPLTPALIYQLGFSIQEHEYFQVFVDNITISQVDKIQQLGASTFTYNGFKYCIVGKLPYDTEGWRHLYCYKIEEVNNG